MSDKNKLNPLSIALGTSFAISLAVSPIANAVDNPFSATSFENGYMLAESHVEGKDGKHKDGKRKDGKRKDGKRKDGKRKDGKRKDGKRKDGEGKCGEGKCGEGKGGEGKGGH